MKKELSPVDDAVACEVCGRTILKGERTEGYLAPGGHRQLVCELCFVRAEHAGWIRESAADQLPSHTPRAPERRALLGRLRRRREDAPEHGHALEPDRASPGAAEPDDAPDDAPDAEPAPSGAGRRRRHGDPAAAPRHVRAVPTDAEVKVERALELFNGSEHQRTVAGLTRTLGYPWATARPDSGAPSAVDVVIAWELSWYRYRVELGDASEPVSLQEKGDQVEDIAEALRSWNAGLDEDGLLVVEGGAGR